MCYDSAYEAGKSKNTISHFFWQYYFKTTQSPTVIYNYTLIITRTDL